jgi:hypothetical protein
MGIFSKNGGLSIKSVMPVLRTFGFTSEKLASLLIEFVPAMLTEAIGVIQDECKDLLNGEEKMTIVSFFPEENAQGKVLYVVVYAALGNGQPTRVLKKSDVRNYLSKIDAEMIDKMSKQNG